MPGSSHSELMPGSLLGKYRIERLLGHGGMATVYLAVQEGTGLEVALKVLMFRGESNRPGGDVARFIREARLAGGIRHPHWVSVYETGYDAKQNLYYIAMERMQASLAQRLRAHGPLPEAEAIAVVEQIAFALDKAFETQMVHRDIKPANILYNAAGVCKLTDFGIAKSSRNEETQLTLREAVFGTPAYMSPEQAKDARMVDTRSDIYSLGTVFFELLSGERPYQGETPVQVLAQVITDKPPPDVRSKPKARKIHSDTAKLVAAMMAKDLSARPQTPSELIARLQKLKAHMPYAKPAENAVEPEYDDSTIMDPTHPPPTDVMLDAGFPSDPGTVRAPTGGAGRTGAWDGAPTGGGNTGGGTGGGVTGTGGGAFGAGAGNEPRTAVSLPTFSVRDGTVGTVGTVGTMGTRFEPVIGRPAAASSGKKGGRKSAAGKVWLAFAVLLLLLLGASFFASSTDFIPNHAGDEGWLGALCRLVYSGPAELPRPMEPSLPGERPIRAETPPSVPLEESAWIDFRNMLPVPVRITPAGTWSETAEVFDVPANDNVVRVFGPGTSIDYKVSTPTSSDYQGAPGHAAAPEGGQTNTVSLTLERRKANPLVSPAWIDFRNTLPVAVRITPTGKWGETAEVFDIPPAGHDLRSFEAGTELTYDVSTPASSDFKDKTGDHATASASGKTNEVALKLEPNRTSSLTATAWIDFRNTLGVPVRITPSGEWAKTAGVFDIPANGNEVRVFGAGAKVSYGVSTPTSDAFQGNDDSAVAPAAGKTNTVELVLAPRKATLLAATAWIDFRNTLGVPVRITPSGEWAKTAGVFDIPANGNEVRVFGAGAKVSYGVSTPTSSDFQPGTGEATAPAAGTTNRVDIVLEKAVGQSQTYATLTLRNPNDATVWVELSGGGSGRHRMLPKGPPLELPIEAGRATSVSYFATDPQFKEYGKANAHTETITGDTALTLTLTKQEAPSLTVANAGDVKLSVTLRSTGDGRELGRGTVEGRKAVKFSGLPVGDPLSLEWTADGVAGYQRGSKPLDGLSWGQAAKEDIKAERLAGPKLEVRNVSSWPLNVEIDGVRTFRLEVDGWETVPLPRAGTYHVKTTVLPSQRDLLTKSADYESTDETVECPWGQVIPLNCWANTKKPEGEFNDDKESHDYNSDLYEAYTESILKSHLKAAKADVDGTWTEHAIAGTIQNIDKSLKAAKRFSRGVDIDAIVPESVSFEKWEQSVAAKASFRNETWHHIVEMTRGSGNWNEFLEEY